MSEQRPLSIFSVALRSFIKTFMGVMGIVFGLMLVLVLLSFDTKGEEEVEQVAKLKVLPNLQGKRVPLDKTSPVILELAIDGVIGSKEITRQAIAELLQESKEGELKESRVKAILLRINSPGGSVIDIDGIYNAIKRYKQETGIPILAFIDGMAASGGFYIATVADEIFATSPSIIGSVGTIIPTQLNFSKPLENWGVESITFSAGKEKDVLNPYRPWDKNDKESLQPLVDIHYQDFVNLVTTARPRLSKEKLINEYGAKIFATNQALEYGYIDQIENDKNVVLKLLAERAGLDPNNLFVVTLEKTNWLKNLFKSETQAVADVLFEQFGIVPQGSPLSRQTLWLWTP